MIKETNAQIIVVGSFGNYFVLSASPSGANYQWFYQDQQNQFHTLVQTQNDTTDCTPSNWGNYYVIVTSNGCSDTSSAFSWICGGVSNLASEINFSMMPNPASDVLNVSYDLDKSSAVAITIVDLTGRRIMNVLNENQTIGKHNQTIRLNNLASGIYLLNFSTEFGSLNSKFVKE